MSGGFGGISSALGDGAGKGLGDVQAGLGDALGKSKDQLQKTFDALKEAPDKLIEKGKEKLNDITNKIGNTNLLDIKNSVMKLFSHAKGFLEKPKTEKEKSIDYIKKLLDMFKDLDDCSLELLKMYIENFTNKLARKMQEKETQKYEEELKNIQEFLDEEKKNKKKKNPINDDNLRFATNLFHGKKIKYFKFQFEEFILILLRYIRFIVGMQAKMEFFENQEVFIHLFLHKKAIPILAESFNYELEVKPYAYQFKLFMRKKFEKPKFKTKLLFKEEEELLVKLIRKGETFDELNQSDQANFPPYFPFERSKTSKFRKYWRDDDYHSCYKDIEFRRYNDIHKTGIFIDVDYHENSESDYTESENEDGVALSPEEKTNLKIKQFLDFKYVDDEDKLCKFIFYICFNLCYYSNYFL